MPIAPRTARACDGLGSLGESVTIQPCDNEMVIHGSSYCGVGGAPSGRLGPLAITVEVGYYGQGMANLLMRHIIRIARNNHLTYLTADRRISLTKHHFHVSGSRRRVRAMIRTARPAPPSLWSMLITAASRPARSPSRPISAGCRTGTTGRAWLPSAKSSGSGKPRAKPQLRRRMA